jgi:hypothetical protein
MRTHRRIAGFLIGAAIASASLLFAVPASAQAMPAPATPSAKSLAESITVNGAGLDAASSFVQSAASSTHISGKIARWEVPICPYAVGIPADGIARVVQKVKGVATQAGAPVSSKPDCKPNIVIAFTSTPQSLLDNIRKDHAEWLGYHSGSGELDRLATVTHPIQAWYSTATVDLQGRHQNDAPPKRQWPRPGDFRPLHSDWRRRQDTRQWQPGKWLQGPELHVHHVVAGCH